MPWSGDSYQPWVSMLEAVAAVHCSIPDVALCVPCVQVPCYLAFGSDWVCCAQLSFMFRATVCLCRAYVCLPLCLVGSTV